MSAVKISQRVTTIDLGAPARVGVGMPLLRLEKASFGESLRTVAVLYARCGMNRRDVCFPCAYATRALLYLSRQDSERVGNG